MMEMKEQTGSRKKYLAPVVVLMLCLVTLTGAAYAYSSTMTYTENNIAAQDLTIDLKGNEVSDASIHIETGKLVTFTDHYSYAYNNAEPPVMQKTDTVKCEVISGLQITYKVQITGDAPGNMVKVCAPDIATFKGTYFNTSAASGAKIGDCVAIKVGFTNDITQATELTANDTYVTCPAAVAKDTDIPVYVFIYAVGGTGTPVTKETAIQTNGIIGDDDVHTASYYKNEFAKATFSLQFEAYYVAP